MALILVHESVTAGDAASLLAPGQRTAAQAELLEAGRAMRDAIVADLVRIARLQVTVALGGQEARPTAWGPQVRTARVPPHEDAAAFVHRQAPLHDLCWVVAPESDGLLLRLHEAVGAQRWLGCSAGAIRIAASKQATCAALQRAGVRTPLDFAAGHRGAWIVKPDDGAGCLDTRRHATHADAQADMQARLAAGQSAVLQPFVDGEALSVSLVVGPDLARPIAFNRQRLALAADGSLHDLGVQPAALTRDDARLPALQSVARAAAAAVPGLRGFVGIDLVWNQGEGPVVIEINPRVTCAYVGLSAILQRNVAAEILALHAPPAAREVAAGAPA